MLNNEVEILKNLKSIKFLLAGILLNRTPNVKEVAKIISCSDKTLTALFPDKQKKGKNQMEKKEQIEQETKEELNFGENNNEN